MQITNKMVADAIGKSETVAYQLLSFLRAINVVKRTGYTKNPGKRGKGAAIYELNMEAEGWSDTQQAFSEALKELLGL